ncbi:phosphoribosylformylglycinamidine synthase I [Candidatus Endolissoclinum faulkneri L2]|uniref:Phosphoribosylformylglycinamidine synthase subunit PurQ n=1 Tax=Candidatus Endolissoclinum faulkneri L2 TaxID=1193729 RepID=K7YP47_9PROT|nr:phosphoribosylformylglycinamidine synthase subunit PurQ [Candidatus Endolissoclinum faulkneri]AFX99307.1 phosphoribosylformylglycinamidine synthase I [Candidatus Endolissoclinum faulkneri L2]
MKTAIVLFPGSNRDRDMSIAIRQSFGNDPLFIWHKETEIPKVDLIIIPGGFSYGDYLRSGAISALSPVMRTVEKQARNGVPVLGVCNGFQILTEARILPGVLMRNITLKFVCKTISLKVENSSSIFSNRYSRGQILSLPVAHNDGNYFADDDTLNRIEDNDQVAFRYVTNENGLLGNPNGSMRDIAGVYNENKTVLGLMPHPENAIYSFFGRADGRDFFDNLIKSLYLIS